MKNVAITLDERLDDAVKSLPGVKRTSLSRFVATLLERELDQSTEQRTQELKDALHAAAAEAKSGWVWNRDDIYER